MEFKKKILMPIYITTYILSWVWILVPTFKKYIFYSNSDVHFK